MKTDMTKEFWKLVLNIAGPGIELQIELDSNDRSELVAERQLHGTAEHPFERYGGREEYIEVRSDLVVARELTRGEIQEEKKPTGEGLQPPPTKEEQADQL